MEFETLPLLTQALLATAGVVWCLVLVIIGNGIIKFIAWVLNLGVILGGAMLGIELTANNGEETGILKFLDLERDAALVDSSGFDGPRAILPNTAGGWTFYLLSIFVLSLGVLYHLK